MPAAHADDKNKKDSVMPEKEIVTQGVLSGWAAHLATWLVGAIIGMGQMLVADEDHKVRQILGQGLVSGGLGASSGAVLLMIPDAPILAVLGASAAIASVGYRLLEQILYRYLLKDRRGEGSER